MRPALATLAALVFFACAKAEAPKQTVPVPRPQQSISMTVEGYDVDMRKAQYTATGTPAEFEYHGRRLACVSTSEFAKRLVCSSDGQLVYVTDFGIYDNKDPDKYLQRCGNEIIPHWATCSR